MLLLQYYIGPGKVKEIVRAMTKLKCCCVIFDAELTPSQQKNLEKSINMDANGKKSSKNQIKVVDRTALILDIFAQHAKTREGQLQVRAPCHLHLLLIIRRLICFFDARRFNWPC